MPRQLDTQMDTTASRESEAKTLARHIYFQHGANTPYVVRERLDDAIEAKNPANALIWASVAAAMTDLFK
jgi:hypothetical protein